MVVAGSSSAALGSEARLVQRVYETHFIGAEVGVPHVENKDEARACSWQQMRRAASKAL